MTILTARQVIKLAYDTKHKEGEVEIDIPASDRDAREAVSCPGGEPSGAYVQAWVWVDFPDGTTYKP